MDVRTAFLAFEHATDEVLIAQTALSDARANVKVAKRQLLGVLLENSSMEFCQVDLTQLRRHFGTQKTQLPKMATMVKRAKSAV
jgi:hypothetical protein